MEDLDKKKQKIKTEKIHPRESANLFSSLFFCWTLPFFVKGLKKDLNDEDLYGTLKVHESRKLGNELKKVWINDEKSHSCPSLRRVLLKVHWLELIYYVFILCIQELVVKLGQPLLVGKIMEYYTPGQTTISPKELYFYGSGIVILSLLNVIMVHYSFFGLTHLALKMQIGCRALIYSKALKLSRDAMVESTVGQIVNLMASDVSRFQYICLHVHQALIGPIQAIVVLYLLFVTVDPTAMVGVGLFLFFIPIIYYMGRLTSRFRFRTSLKTDNRIRLMNEIVSGIQVIKMCTWELSFAKLIQKARELELYQIKYNAYLRSVFMATSTFLAPSAIFLCVLTYILTGNRLNAQYLYMVISFYGTLRPPLTMHLPRCIAMLAEVNVSLKRVETFLKKDEVKEETAIKSEGVAISLEKVQAKWKNADFGLENINFSAKSGELIAVVGKVGSGKSTLVQVILREAPILQGNLKVEGTISYASQEPWLFSSSIRQNILFGDQMDPEKYKKVVRVCALERDFSLFPHSDHTIVGEKGIMLSGGQKARVGLARAIYRDADIYILDDPLSAVDVNVGKALFEDCICGYLKNKCTILVTHQIQYLNRVNRIYLLDNGKVAANGSYEQLKSSDYMKTLLEIEKIHTAEEKENKKALLQKQKSIIVDDEKERPVEVKEHKAQGKVSKKVYLHYFQANGGCLYPFFVLLTFVLTQLVASGLDNFLSIWVNLEQERLQFEIYNNTYNDNQSYPETFFTSENMLYIYSVLIFFLILMVLVQTFSFIQFSIKAAKILHDKMFDRVVHSTMRFFNVNPSGRILNRFSRDLSLVDENLPTTIADCINVLLSVVAVTIIVSIINPWIIIPTVLVFFLFYGYKVVYMATSRDLKRMQSTSRSPIFSHLSASLQGLPTIRALEAQKLLEREFDQIQDHNTSVSYLAAACTRTFGLSLDVSCSFYIGLVVFSFFFIGTETYGGKVGLAITQAIALTGTLQRGIRQWSELENQMTSVERIFEYTELEPEADSGNKTVPKNWPEEGKIGFDNVSLKYHDDAPVVLKNLTFNISAKEKIGVVGRTGAGKSSMISALFRLAQKEGTISIDNINTNEIPLSTLRKSLSIIPQEPVLFSGSLRKNLDPFDEYSDDMLWDALEQVELKSTVIEMPAGLSSRMAEGGSNFSVGERQLLCLARTIIRKNKILVLDEATANVDLHTDELIQKTIRDKFQDCTVLTIAHRLHTIIDSDKVLVLDGGRIVEFDHPYMLLKNTGGMFYSLVQQSGKVVAANLIKKARESFTPKSVHVREEDLPSVERAFEFLKSIS